ncbi:MAG: hypothetical protein ABIK09_19605 [Pseudomonadota bacterium]
MLRQLALAAFILLSAAACDSGGASQAPADTTPTPDMKPDVIPATGLPFQDFYDEVRNHALGHDYLDGDWLEDFGDAAFWGPAFLVRVGTEEDRGDYLAVAQEAFQRNLAVLRQATGDLGFFMDSLDEVLMSALGVIEVLSATGKTEGLYDLDALLDLVNLSVEGLGTYLDVDVDSYALNTYGPTAITATVALLNLRYAELLDTPLVDERLATGRAMMAATDEKAWGGDAYLFRPGEEKRYLYPNVITIMANTTAYRLTGEAAYRDRALQTYQGIQVLKAPDLGCYYSPYSAVTMGAQTEVYSTLSSQNYTIMALALLWEVTGDQTYRDEIVEIATFIEDRLWQDGRILHHWMDGHIAVPTDPEYFCSGCNLQFLYASWYAMTYVWPAL